MITQFEDYGMSGGMTDAIKEAYEDTLFYNKAIQIGTFMGKLLKDRVSRQVRISYTTSKEENDMKKGKIKIKGLSKEDATKFVNWFELEGIFSFNEYIGNLTCGNVTIDLDSIDEEDNEFEIHLSRDGND